MSIAAIEINADIFGRCAPTNANHKFRTVNTIRQFCVIKEIQGNPHGLPVRHHHIKLIQHGSEDRVLSGCNKAVHRQM